MDMERKQTEKPGKPVRRERPGNERDSKEPRHGEGAASALATLKRLERDRSKTRPADDSHDR
jgi:hypothetical protein